MTGRDFMRYLAKRTLDRFASYVPGSDPQVEMYDGVVRIIDLRGEELPLRAPLPRQLRIIAMQLVECADEIERRAFESERKP